MTYIFITKRNFYIIYIFFEYLFGHCFFLSSSKTVHNKNFDLCNVMINIYYNI